VVTRIAFAALLLAAGAGRGAADDKDVPQTEKVEVMLCKEHVPEGLKAGAHVNLLYVASATRTGTGKTMYATRVITPDAAVVTVKELEKPATPDEAIKVELQVPKDQVAKIEQYKTRLVRVSESNPGGGRQMVQKPVPLRLEITKAK
jgi:hypothetical protein